MQQQQQQSSGISRPTFIGYILIFLLTMSWLTWVYGPYVEQKRRAQVAGFMEDNKIWAGDQIRGGLAAAAWYGRHKSVPLAEAEGGAPHAGGPENGGGTVAPAGGGGADDGGEPPEEDDAARARRLFREAAEAAAAAAGPIDVSTNHVATRWSANGGKLRAITMGEDREGVAILDRTQTKPFVLLPDGLTAELGGFELRRVTSSSASRPDKRGSRGERTLGREAWKATAVAGNGTQFDYLVDEDLWVSKVFRLTEGEENAFSAYLDVVIENRGAKTQTFGYELSVAPGLVEESVERGGGVLGIVCQRFSGGIIQSMQTRYADTDPLIATRVAAGDQPEEVAFFGVAAKYFATIVVPLDVAEMDALPAPGSAEGLPFVATPPARSQLAYGRGFLDSARAVNAPDPLKREALIEKGTPEKEAKEDTERANVAAFGQVNEIEIPAGRRVVHRYLVYVGPKDDRVLDTYTGLGLEQILDLGWFGTLSRIFVSLLRGIYSILGSYGIGIIILTIGVRAMIHPLSRMTQRSQKKMQKLAPQMAEIKEKYKGKTGRESMTKMQAEMTGLYAQHGMTPLSGCLPFLTIFFQLPVFLGLYNGLNYAFELRQKSFLYIDDLSAPDALFDLGFELPFLGSDTFNLLPILMLVVMLVQQKLTPKPTDPQQQQVMKMMSFFLLFLVFIFYTVPSGLVLYFLTSSLIGIGESQYIRRKMAAEEDAEGGAPTPPAPQRSSSKK